MTSLAEVLAGHDAAVEVLAAADGETWKILVEHLFESGSATAPAPLVEAMLRREPDPAVWLGHARDAVANVESQWFTTISSALRRVRPWLAAGIRAARAPHDPAVLRLRLDEVRSSTGDDALESARALVGDLARASASPELRAEASLLLARRAHESGETDEGLEAARQAATVDPAIAALAARQEGAILLGARRIEEALAVLAPVMTTPGPLFGGGGAFASRGFDDPLDAALDEAATIAGWATDTTPEWVRALGGIAERSGRDWARFQQALSAMVSGSESPIPDLEVVARQAAERGMQRTSLAAAAMLADRFGESLEAASIAAPHLVAAGRRREAWQVLARAADAAPSSDPDKGNAFLRAAEVARDAGDLHEATSLLERARSFLDEGSALRARIVELDLDLARSDEGAIDRGLALLAEVARDPETLAETREGHAIVDVLVRALLARRDRRALEVQGRLVEAKRAIWGECPALAMEQHNLATIHAELGDRAVAREGLEAALRKLQRALGARHPHVLMAKRSLARLERG